MGSLPILCLDFDGVLHSYRSGWQGVDVIPDPPVDGAVEWLEAAVGHFDVQIFSARSREVSGRNAMASWLRRNGVTPAVLAQIKFPDHKPPASVTLDDRAITFEGTWPSIQSLLDFKPWNKR